MDKKDVKLKRTPLILDFYASPMSGEEIEAKSLGTVDREATAHRFTAEEWKVVQRMIHTTADSPLSRMSGFHLMPSHRPFTLCVPGARCMLIPI